MAEQRSRIAPEEAERRERALHDFSDSFVAERDEQQVRSALAQWAHTDIEWVEDPSWPGSDTYHGFDEIIALRADHTESFDYEQTVERILHSGDKMVALVSWRGRAQSSGAEAEMSLALLITWRQDRVARIEFIFDRERALREAGIGPGE